MSEQTDRILYTMSWHTYDTTKTATQNIALQQKYYIIGCESSPISRNVRSLVSQSVSQLVLKCKNKEI